YLRVSTEQQIENYSIPLQKERLQAFCHSKGWNNITEYLDAGYSGSNLERPSLKQLQKDIKNNKINMVIVYRLDRLSRSQHDTLYLIEEIFSRHGVEFISLSETIDTTTAFGRAMIGVMSTFAQLEREMIIDRFRSCHQKMVQDEGLWAGSAGVQPYGYTRLQRGQLVVNEEEQKHIIRIFEEYINLKSYAKIHRKLEAEGFPKIRNVRMIHILQNKLYIGEVSFAGEWFKGSHKPLVPVELFNTVQEIIKNNRVNSYGKVKNKVFTGKVFCGQCGEEYHPYATNAKLATGKKVTYYHMICARRKIPSRYDSKCFNRNMKREIFEKEIFSRIENLNTSGEIELVNKSLQYKKEINKIDKKISKILDLYMDDRL
ncbi:MAG: recombinase family protein, partial [Turicibacter sanguinis]